MLVGGCCYLWTEPSQLFCSAFRHCAKLSLPAAFCCLTLYLTERERQVSDINISGRTLGKMRLGPFPQISNYSFQINKNPAPQHRSIRLDLGCRENSKAKRSMQTELNMKPVVRLLKTKLTLDINLWSTVQQKVYQLPFIFIFLNAESSLKDVIQSLQ